MECLFFARVGHLVECKLQKVKYRWRSAVDQCALNCFEVEAQRI